MTKSSANAIALDVKNILNSEKVQKLFHKSASVKKEDALEVCDSEKCDENKAEDCCKTDDENKVEDLEYVQANQIVASLLKISEVLDDLNFEKGAAATLNTALEIKNAAKKKHEDKKSKKLTKEERAKAMAKVKEEKDKQAAKDKAIKEKEKAKKEKEKEKEKAEKEKAKKEKK